MDSKCNQLQIFVEKPRSESNNDWLSNLYLLPYVSLASGLGLCPGSSYKMTFDLDIAVLIRLDGI